MGVTVIICPPTSVGEPYKEGRGGKTRKAPNY